MQKPYDQILGLKSPSIQYIVKKTNNPKGTYIFMLGS
jgi:hypothetical protein